MPAPPVRYADFYTASAHPRLSADVRSVGSGDVRLLRMRQGAHALDDPATDELVVGFVLGGQTRCRWTWGDGWNDTAARSAGDFGLSPIRAAGTFEVDGPHELLVIGIPTALAVALAPKDRGDPPSYGRLHEVYNRDAIVSRLCRLLWRLGATPDSLAADTAIEKLLWRFSDLAGQTPKNTPSVKPLSTRAFNLVCARMQDDLSASHRLVDLARLAGLSASAFSRAFKARTGQSPHAYLLRARIEAARAALAQPQVDIDAIALGLGFAHRAHFNRVFARVTGMTPTQAKNAR